MVDTNEVANDVNAKLGHRLSHVDPEDMTTVQKHIESVVPNVDSRVAMEYTVTMSSALVVRPFTKQESSYSVLMVPFVKNCAIIIHAKSIQQKQSEEKDVLVPRKMRTLSPKSLKLQKVKVLSPSSNPQKNESSLPKVASQKRRGCTPQKHHRSISGKARVQSTSKMEVHEIPQKVKSSRKMMVTIG